MRSTILIALSLLVLAGCSQSPASPKDGDLESRLLTEEVGDTDIAADGFTRLVDVRGAISLGETIDSTYGESRYAGWVFTANAGARIALDAMATDGSDTVLMLYGPQTASGWARARPIAVNDDYRGSTNSHLDVRLARSGTYLVIVREYWEDAGAFSLTLACSGTECRTECGADDRCPTGSECHRVVCIRAPCPSFCAPIVAPPAPTEVSCGGRAGNTCTATQFCDFSEAAMCGYADGQGVCRARPEACTALYSPVCGCDGVTYSSACNAQSRGMDALHAGPC